MKASSYIAPVCAVCALGFADYCIIIIQPNNNYVWLVCYNLFVFLALWSLLSTYFTDPGFVPINGKYDLSKLPRLVASLYKQTCKYQHAKIDINEFKNSY